MSFISVLFRPQVNDERKEEDLTQLAVHVIGPGGNYTARTGVQISDCIIKRLINGPPNLPFKMLNATVVDSYPLARVCVRVRTCTCVFFKCTHVYTHAHNVTPMVREYLPALTPVIFNFRCYFTGPIAECKITRIVWLIVFVYHDNYTYL